MTQEICNLPQRIKTLISLSAHWERSHGDWHVSTCTTLSKLWLIWCWNQGQGECAWENTGLRNCMYPPHKAPGISSPHYVCFFTCFTSPLALSFAYKNPGSHSHFEQVLGRSPSSLLVHSHKSPPHRDLYLLVAQDWGRRGLLLEMPLHRVTRSQRFCLVVLSSQRFSFCCSQLQVSWPQFSAHFHVMIFHLAVFQVVSQLGLPCLSMKVDVLWNIKINYLGNKLLGISQVLVLKSSDHDTERKLGRGRLE